MTHPIAANAHGRLFRQLALWLAGLCMASGALAASDFASVWRVRGDVVVVDGQSGARRMLKAGDAVRVGERVSAAANAEAMLKTLDGGAIAVRPGAEFLAERFAAEGKPTDGAILRILTGSLRLISGWIGSTNRAGHLVHTPTATIGIRGTDHEPYVMSAEMAKQTSYKEGTYDKVNRGRTALEVGVNSLEIDAGRVGFAPTSPPKQIRMRALLTVLLPVLLDKIPDFYVPGEFDAEMDQYSEVADTLNQRELERLGHQPAAAAPATPPAAAPATEPTPAAASAAPAPRSAAAPPGCDPSRLGQQWLDALDGAIKRLDADAIVAGFAADVVVRASVRNKEGGLSTVEMGRDELVRSTIAAVKNLEDYRQRRVSTASTLDAATPGQCARLTVDSVVIEQGRQAGKPFRFESLEHYVLELRDGKWLAVRAETTQR